MELISKISKGSRMDQIYIPKNRLDFDIGSYVIVKPLKTEKKAIKPFFYNINSLEPIKVRIINEIFENLTNIIDSYDNILITGSFLEKGFNFNDIDIILINKNGLNKNYIEKLLEDKIGVKIHIISINNKALIKGLRTDPLYQTMLSKCVSRKRFVYRIKPKINYKILDLHLLKSKLLAENFDFLNGNEKYEMVRNAVSIASFIENEVINKRKVDEKINRLFGEDMNIIIKENRVINKKDFLDKYKIFYKALSSKILKRIGPKQK